MKTPYDSARGTVLMGLLLTVALYILARLLMHAY
jgi:hypothetical protein